MAASPRPSVHGLLLVDKPSSWTSHDLVAYARRSLGTKEIGHCGTLDPLASGLMVLLVGEGTKVSSYVLDQDKTYEVVVRLGVETDSYDRDGQVTCEKEVSVSLEQVQQAVAHLTGALEIRVPIFSAIKVDGRKLYDRARADEAFEAPLRTMEFKRVELVDFQSPYVTARIWCSKGSYIRSWAHELGVLLGTGATVQELRRLRSEPYSIEDAITVDDLGKGADAAQQKMIPLAQALPDWMTLMAEGQDARLLTNGGISYRLKTRLMAEFKIGLHRGTKVIDSEGKMLALLEFRAGQGFVIRRVFRH